VQGGPTFGSKQLSLKMIIKGLAKSWQCARDEIVSNESYAAQTAKR